MQQEDKRQVAVLVVSCDNYSDVWPIFFQLYGKYWNNNDFRTYLLTNNLQPEFENVEVLSVGEDISWSDNLLNALPRIEEEFVLLFIEDLLLTKPINLELFHRCLDWALARNASYFRFNPATYPDIVINNEIGIISRGAVYRTSVVLSLWKKEVLCSLLKPGENAWEFEHHGAVRSDKYDDFYSATSTIFPVINSIIKRVWERSAVRKLSRLGITIDISYRPVTSLTGEVLWKFRLLRSMVFTAIPGKWRRSVKRFFQRDNYKY